MPSLFDPVTLGALTLKNRIFMSPLTRCRASGDDGRTPNEVMEKYYVQRASAGLIISEATAVTPMGVGYRNTPGIWSPAHVEGWKKITTAVHRAGGKMLLQLWHVGRISSPDFLEGKAPVAPSAIAADGHVSLVRPKQAYPVPRALELDEIAATVEAFRVGAANAKLAGFDGVEIHGANGYLLDQFLHDGSNHRTDRYGGSIENRARFMMEVTDAVVSVWGSDMVGMHLAPRSDSHSMADSNPRALFSYVAEELGKRKLAFLCTREFEGPDSLSPLMKKLFRGPLVANEQFSLQSANMILQRGDADAVAFGKLFIANPDLVARFSKNADYNPLVAETIYALGTLGYSDYPALND